MKRRKVVVEFDVWSKDDDDANQIVYEYLQIHLPQINRWIETWKINTLSQTIIEKEKEL